MPLVVRGGASSIVVRVDQSPEAVTEASGKPPPPPQPTPPSLPWWLSDERMNQEFGGTEVYAEIGKLEDRKNNGLPLTLNQFINRYTDEVRVRVAVCRTGLSTYHTIQLAQCSTAQRSKRLRCSVIDAFLSLPILFSHLILFLVLLTCAVSDVPYISTCILQRTCIQSGI